MTIPSPSVKPAPYTSEAEILANALVSDKPEIMCIDQLTPEVQAHIAAARQKGFHLVSVRWTTGEFALMFCMRGSNMPSPQNVVPAYHQCRHTNKIFPEGITL